MLRPCHPLRHEDVGLAETVRVRQHADDHEPQLAVELERVAAPCSRPSPRRAADRDTDRARRCSCGRSRRRCRDRSSNRRARPRAPRSRRRAHDRCPARDGRGARPSGAVPTRCRRSSADRRSSQRQRRSHRSPRGSRDRHRATRARSPAPRLVCATRWSRYRKSRQQAAPRPARSAPGPLRRDRRS